MGVAVSLQHSVSEILHCGSFPMAAVLHKLLQSGSFPQGTVLQEWTAPVWVPHRPQGLPRNLLLHGLVSTGSSSCLEPALPWSSMGCRSHYPKI